VPAFVLHRRFASRIAEETTYEPGNNGTKHEEELDKKRNLGAVIKTVTSASGG
jgi:hypothetical protein